MTADVDNITVSAFLGDAVTVKVEPPRDYISASGATSTTGWIITIGDGPNRLQLHCRSLAAVYAIRDATAIPPEG